MAETKAVALKCTGCGGALEIAPDMDSFSCGYCGLAQVVERRGGTVALKAVADAVSRVQAGTDRTAAELAIARLTGEIEQEKSKAMAAVRPLQASEKASRKTATTAFVACLTLGGLPAFVGVMLLLSGAIGGGVTSLILGVAIGGVCFLVGRSANHSANRLDAKVREIVQESQGKIEALETKVAAARTVVD